MLSNFGPKVGFNGLGHRERILTKRSVSSDSNLCNCWWIPGHFCFEYHVIQRVNLTQCLDLINSRIFPTRLSFWAWGAEGQMWSLKELYSRAGDPLTSFSFGFLEQQHAMLLDFFRREKSDLSGEPSFISWHSIGIKMLSVLASCSLAHNEIYSHK